MPQVSVVLPVRDGAQSLGVCLESLLAQTFRDFEVVVVDDHSRDGSAQLAEEFARRDPRVCLTTCPDPGGIVQALQEGCHLAAGDLIARMDADDTSPSDRLARQVGLLDQRPEIDVVSGAVEIVREGEAVGEGYARYQEWLNGLAESAAIARERFIESPVAHPSVVMRRGALERVGGYRDVGFPEDYDLWLRMLGQGMVIAKVPGVVLRWVDHEERASRQESRYSLKSFLRCKAHHLARLPRVRDHGVTLWGAGPIGKRIAHGLRREGAGIEAFVEVNPRRVGQEIQGAPVVATESVQNLGRSLHLSAVGQPGQREVIREILRGLGGIEGESFFCVA